MAETARALATAYSNVGDDHAESEAYSTIIPRIGYVHILLYAHIHNMQQNKSKL